MSNTQPAALQPELGPRAWAAILPRFEWVIESVYAIAVGLTVVPPELMTRERRKLELLLTGELGSEFRDILASVVRDNIAAGLDCNTYVIGYGVYEGLLLRALDAGLGPDEPDRGLLAAFVAERAHHELSMTVAEFIHVVESEAAAERHGLASRFEGEVLGRLRHVEERLASVRAESERTRSSGAQAGEAAAEGRSRAADVGHRMEAVNDATHELSKDARALAEQVTVAAKASATARANARDAEQIVEKLALEGAGVEEVVRLIRTIADQTRMLALNATIEAARAGEAGRGFAVVASEVKDLARDTAEATDRIADRVEAIQGSSSGARASMLSVLEAIEEMDEVTTAIAASGEERSVGTQEIARNAEQTVAVVREMRSGAEALASFVESTLDAGHHITGQVDQVAAATRELSATLGEFLRALRGDAVSEGASERAAARI